MSVLRGWETGVVAVAVAPLRPVRTLSSRSQHAHLNTVTALSNPRSPQPPTSEFRGAFIIASSRQKVDEVGRERHFTSIEG